MGGIKDWRLVTQIARWMQHYWKVAWICFVDLRLILHVEAGQCIWLRNVRLENKLNIAPSNTLTPHTRPVPQSNQKANSIIFSLYVISSYKSLYGCQFLSILSVASYERYCQIITEVQRTNGSLPCSINSDEKDESAESCSAFWKNNQPFQNTSMIYVSRMLKHRECFHFVSSL